MHEKVETDDRDLRGKARAAIQAGKLPDRAPDRTWGGPGAGARCALCDAVVKPDDLEMELEFVRERDRGLDRYQVHLRCFTIWERERRKPPLVAAGGGQSAASDRGAAAGRSLPRGVDTGNIDGRERDRRHEAGPA